MTLTTFETLNGIFSIIFVAISIIIGLIIASKYPKFKQRAYILIGIVWMGIVSPWYPSTVSTIANLLFGTPIPDELYLALGNVLLPIISICWMTAFTDLKYKKYQKVIVGLFIIFGIIYEVFFFYFLFTDITVIGQVTGPVDVKYGLIITLYQLILLVIIIITGTIFARQSLKSEDHLLNLKGRFLLLAFYSFFIGSVLDIFSTENILLLIIARIILITSSIEFYCGFLLPRWMQELFKK